MKSRLRTGMARIAPLLGGALLASCTYGIVLDAGGQSVSTDWSGQRVGGCRDIGKVTVSVMSRVGPVDRNDIKVRDELEIMARNQAAQMHADTITPLGDPHDGEQSWEAFSCGTVAPQGYAPAYPPPPPSNSGAPVEEVPPANAPPQSGYPPPPSDNYPPPPSGYPPQQDTGPQPFSEPLPAGSSAQTYPASGSSS